MRIFKCFYCGCPIYPGHGMCFIRNDCRMFRFCSSKCNRHFKVRHDPKKSKWTKAYRKTMGKELIYDKSLEFEQQKVEPIKYDRDQYVKTIKLIRKIQKLKNLKAKIHWHTRMKIAKQKNNNAITNELKKHIDLIDNKRLKEELLTSIKKKSQEDASN